MEGLHEGVGGKVGRWEGGRVHVGGIEGGDGRVGMGG